MGLTNYFYTQFNALPAV